MLGVGPLGMPGDGDVQHLQRCRFSSSVKCCNADRTRAQ